MNQYTSRVSLPSSARSISITGPMTIRCKDEMLEKFKTMIQESSEPITLYIGSSMGGSLDAFYAVHKFFGQVAQGNNSCHLITVVRGQTQSVAAFLGVIGHRSYVERSSQLTFHGARCADYQKGMILTREAAAVVAIRLQAENRKIAKMLAEAVVLRVVHRFLDIKMKSKQRQRYRRNLPMHDLVRFAKHIDQDIISKKCREVVEDALNYVTAMNDFQNLRFIIGRRRVKNDATNCKAYLAHRLDECAANNWPIDEFSVIEIVSEYFSLKDAMSGDGLEVVNELCRRFGGCFLSGRELKKFMDLQLKTKKKADEYLSKKTTPMLLVLWNFAFALSARLLTGQTSVFAEDACLLGLIDEIIEPNRDAGRFEPGAGEIPLPPTVSSPLLSGLPPPREQG